jgi:hypothetical protein
VIPLPKAVQSVINQTLTVAATTRASRSAGHGYQVVDAECDQGEYDEEDDDYYCYYVVLLGHFGGLWVLFVCWSRRVGVLRWVGVSVRRTGEGEMVVDRECGGWW